MRTHKKLRNDSIFLRHKPLFLNSPIPKALLTKLLPNAEARNPHESPIRQRLITLFDAISRPCFASLPSTNV
jgi:hypothetical protein